MTIASTDTRTRAAQGATNGNLLLQLTLRAAVGLTGLLWYHGVERRGMRWWLIAAGRSCRMRVGSRQGRRGWRYRLLGLLHVTGGRGCCRGGAVTTPGTSHGTAGWLLLLRRLLLLLLLRRLQRWRWFLRVRRRLAYRFCNEKRDSVLNINSPGFRGVLGAHIVFRDTAGTPMWLIRERPPISKAVMRNLHGITCAKVRERRKR